MPAEGTAMHMPLSESQDRLVDVKGLEPSASHWASISATLRPGDTRALRETAE